jgi:hypothetical protein
MAQSFTKNYRDHSNDHGFQFEFCCEKCGNGHRSTFKNNTMGMAASLLNAASSLFGGSLGLDHAAAGAHHVKDAARGAAWDAAFREAIEEIRPRFHQCTKCGRWVCPDVCWNPQRGLCEDCAPRLEEHAAAIQAQVAVEQMWDKARGSDQTGGADLKTAQTATCPHCRATIKQNAKFCEECGKPVGAAKKTFCAECGTELGPNAKFCGGCGAARG